MTEEELAALMGLVEARVRELVKRETSRVAQVTSVNVDGSVNLDVAGAVVPSQPALTGYTGRAVGDVVDVLVRSGELLVLGRSGTPAAAAIVADTDPPAGQGWRAVTTGIWARADGALWLRPAGPPAPPPGGVVTRLATRYTTYRGGTQILTTAAGQGDWTGAGLRTGLATFGPGAWAELAGKTPTGGAVTVHRSGQAHGSYGPVPLAMTFVPAGNPPPTTPESGAPPVVGYAEVNGTTTVGLPPAQAAAFAADSGMAVRFYSGNSRDYALVDRVTVSITY